jgi:hypothetical protein
MDNSELISIAEGFVEDYKGLLHIDPYYRIKVELADSNLVSSCSESAQPATWVLNLSPAHHNDELDVRMSVVSAALTVLFRDIEDSKKRQEVISKLTHTLVELTSPDSDEESGAIDADSD